MNSILVVEDDAIIAQDIQLTLTRLGYSVPRTARSGDEAVRAMAELKPDLVLMDIKLRGKLDGIETAALIRKSWDVPVVYLTAHSDDSTLARAKETGPHGYLLKPFNERDLRTAVEVALRKHELEMTLAERERWFSTTLQSIGDAVIATDPVEGITFMNPAAERLTGWSADEARGMKLDAVLRLVSKNGEPLESPVVRALRKGFSVELPPDTRLVAKGGTSLDVDDSSAPIVDDRGRVMGVVVVFRNVTERKKMEQRLASSERLASIGTMAAGMGHEINNPLAVVIANVGCAFDSLGTLKRDLASIPGTAGLAEGLNDLLEALSDANQAGDRVRRIVHDLKKFARVDPVTSDIIDLPNALEAAIKMVDNQMRHSATLVREYGTTPLVQANEGRLVQVFTNLLINAAQAIGDGKAATHQIRLVTFTDNAGRAVAEIYDTGPGIAQANLGRIFDPFYSTKPIGVGMGLGLAISHSVIAAIGGEISVESEVGRGTVFRVAIPPTNARSTDRAKRETTPPIPSRRGHVLVIDDEPAVGRTIWRVLRDYHDVIVETDGHAALRRITGGEAFDVIFCDLMMPNMTGIDVYDAVHSVSSEIANRIVFLTGGVFSPRAEAFLGDVANLTISKPFNGESLRAIAADYVK